MRKLIYVVVVLSLIFATPAVVQAQTAATASVSGVVTDPTGAVIPGARVELTDEATGITRNMETDAAGQYVFVGITPGSYTLTATMAGFRTATVPDIKFIAVAKSYTINVTLEVGAIAEVVEVTAGTGVELQTSDSTVGNVIKRESLLRLPSINRSATNLFDIQPGVAPRAGSNTGGAVTGARSDQTTWLLDGTDITDNIIASGGDIEPTVPVPAESIDEFRMSVTNPNATFGRAAGGQMSLVTKRGSNDFHGSAYWYHQNDNLNANTWQNNRTDVEKAELKDNRFGFSAGGPIAQDNTFFFWNYEGRRFSRSANISRTVPTPSLRAGILTFPDAAGNDVQYNLDPATGAISTLCGDGTQACDPRGIGISPVVSAIWNFYPTPNDPTGISSQGTTADGLNTQLFRSSLPLTTEFDYAVLRLDHNFTQNWRFEGSFRASRELSPSSAQVDIGGVLPGNTLGQPATLGDFPVRGRHWIAALTGQITPRLTNEFRFAFNKQVWSVVRQKPSPAVQGNVTNVPINFDDMDEPIDIAVQQARSQGINDEVLQFIDNLTWVKGRHTLQFGTTIRRDNMFHNRDDNVVGAMAAIIGFSSGVTLPASARPPTCGGSLTTNCLLSADVGRWDAFYGDMMGMVTNLQAMGVRDQDLNPLPIGADLIADAVLWSPEFYFSDTWRATSSLTINFGLMYQWQTPPVEKLRRMTFMVDATTGAIINPDDFLAQKRATALRGLPFTPTLGFSPLGFVGKDTAFDTDWSNLGPSFALSWNPSFESGFLGALFGDRKTVLRGGYRVVYDRLNTVQTIVIPMLGVGFKTTQTVLGPLCTAGTAPGAGCNAAGNVAEAAFRIGTDGDSPLPSPPTAIPGGVVVPRSGFLDDLFTFQVDPTFQVARNHMLNFTIQRELPGDMLMEISWVGRFARNLNQAVNLNQVPYMHTDPASGQSFAVAFDAVATELRAGVAAAALTPQPWFENQLPGTGTVGIASFFGSFFVNGNLNLLFQLEGFGVPLDIDLLRQGAGLPTLTNRQMTDTFMRSDGGLSNYHGLLLTLRKRPSHGLMFDANFTWSKSLDQIGAVQNSASNFPNSFDFNASYGPSFFDHTYLFNLNAIYELPLGRGRRFSAENWLDKVAGGWFVSSIVQAQSGFPMQVNQQNDVWGGGLIFAANTGAIALSKPNQGNDLKSGIAGSGGVGTAGDPATGGTGLNIFSDPEAMFNNFRHILISQDTRYGRGYLRGLSRWFWDFSLGKKTGVTETVNVVFQFDFLNLLNTPAFNDPGSSPATSVRGPSLLNPRAFGVVTTQFVPIPRAFGTRQIQFGLRVEF